MDDKVALYNLKVCEYHELVSMIEMAQSKYVRCHIIYTWEGHKLSFFL